MLARYIARIVFIILITLSLTYFSHILPFMTLNLILAYIPFELCFLLKLFKPHKAYEWPLFILFGMIFVLMVPNTFYMVTDMIHLNQFSFDFRSGLVLMEWAHFSFLVAGVCLALYCLCLMFLELDDFTTHVWLNRVLVFALMFLDGLGIYIGRFLRFHSVYLINEPSRIFTLVWQQFDLNAFIFILFMVLLQGLLYLFMKGVRIAK